MNSEYHSGCSFGFAMRYSAPRPDWWSVESVIPKITAPTVRPVRIRWILTAPSRSAIAGENSMSSAIM